MNLALINVPPPLTAPPDTPALFIKVSFTLVKLVRPLLIENPLTVLFSKTLLTDRKSLLLIFTIPRSDLEIILLFINVELYIPFLILLIWPLPELFSNKRLFILTALLIKLEETTFSIMITLFISPLIWIKYLALHFSNVQLSIFTM